MDLKIIVLKQLHERLRRGWMEHYEIGTLVPQSMMSVEEAISGVERLLDDGFILERGGDDSKRPCYRIRQNRKPIDHASPQMW